MPRKSSLLKGYSMLFQHPVVASVLGRVVVFNTKIEHGQKKRNIAFQGETSSRSATLSRKQTLTFFTSLIRCSSSIRTSGLTAPSVEKICWIMLPLSFSRREIFFWLRIFIFKSSFFKCFTSSWSLFIWTQLKISTNHKWKVKSFFRYYWGKITMREM